MTRKLRSNFPHGPGLRAVRNAPWRALDMGGGTSQAVFATDSAGLDDQVTAPVEPR